jgi:EmrB/QacA subfamily drug resistance transporter
MTHSIPGPDTPAFVLVTRVPRRTWIVLGVLVAGLFMALLDTTIVNVALPTIRTSLDASDVALTWIISGYVLAFGLMLIPAGRMGDRFGHKWLFFAGLGVFTIGSLLCGIAQDSIHLIIARVIQGAGGGIFVPAVTAYIQLLFPPLVRGRAFAVVGSVTGLASACGPLAGGLIIEAFGESSGWRWIFAVNIPIGVAAMVAAAILLPAGGRRKRMAPDLLGLALLSLALVAILVPLIQGQDAGCPLWTLVTLAAGLLLFGAFVLWQRRAAAHGVPPLVPPRLFAHASFSGGTILAFVFFAGFTSIFFTISLLWQAGLGHSALESGLVAIPFSIGNVIAASQSARLAERLGRGVLVLGTAMLTAGLVALLLVLLLVPAAQLTSWALLVPLLVGGAGSGLFIAPNSQFIVANVERPDAGAASAVISTTQRIGAAIGIAVVGGVLFGTLGDVAGAAELPAAFARAAAAAVAVSAAFAVAALALVFTLPRRVPRR